MILVVSELGGDSFFGHSERCSPADDSLVAIVVDFDVRAIFSSSELDCKIVSFGLTCLANHAIAI